MDTFLIFPCIVKNVAGSYVSLRLWILIIGAIADDHNFYFSLPFSQV